MAGYSFSLGERGAMQSMVPFWDMLNHAAPALASVALRHDAARGRLEMVSVRRCAAGSEVFNTYGPLGNAELLRRYGFVTKARQVDVLLRTRPLRPRAPRARQHKVAHAARRRTRTMWRAKPS